MKRCEGWRSALLCNLCMARHCNRAVSWPQNSCGKIADRGIVSGGEFRPGGDGWFVLLVKLSVFAVVEGPQVSRSGVKKYLPATVCIVEGVHDCLYASVVSVQTYIYAPKYLSRSLVSPFVNTAICNWGDLRKWEAKAPNTTKSCLVC